MCEEAKAVPSARAPILSDAEVSQRMMLLAELQAALAGLGVHSVLARHHRLVLQYGRSPCEPSGMTDPTLHIFASDGTDIATTDGKTYSLTSGANGATSDPKAAAAEIARRHRTAAHT